MTENTDAGNQFSAPEFVKLIKDRIEELRKRLLDSSGRNPLINVPFDTKSPSYIRIVDEIPDLLRSKLVTSIPMLLAPLPSLEKPLPDEQTDEFQNALAVAQRSDEEYLEALKAIDAKSSNANELKESADQGLRDRLREKSGLPPRHTDLAEHARAHGIQPDHDLPHPKDKQSDGRHDDTSIQTLLLPERLRRIARRLHERAQSFEREKGVNVMHTAFGLLEWQPPNGGKRFQSPLLVLETRLLRKHTPQGTQFHIESGDRVELNTTLQVTLEADHSLYLPAYNEEAPIETFFEEIAAVAPEGWTWKVHRQVLVGLFPSSKIEMYHDLDPTDIDLKKASLVAQLLGTTTSSFAMYADDHSPDDPKVERKVRHLVLDADASQFSSIVDIADGKSIAIEGPPGSGKSQTIVNIIANAMSEGKKVLFVAEKLAALDVVKSRLEAVGLGEFVLPLQAGKSSTDRVYKSLANRLDAKGSPMQSNDSFETTRAHYRNGCTKFQAYLDALHSPVPNANATVHEIFGRAIGTSEARSDLPPNLRRSLKAVPTMTREDIDSVLVDAKAFGSRMAQLENASPLWLHATKVVTSIDDAEYHAQAAGEIASQIESFVERASESPLSAAFEIGVSPGAILAWAKEHAGCLSTANRTACMHTLQSPKLQKWLNKLLADMMKRSKLREHLEQKVTNPEVEHLEQKLRAAVSFARREGDGLLSTPQHLKQADEARAKVKALAALEEEILQLPRCWQNPTRSLSSVSTGLKLLLACGNKACATGIRMPFGTKFQASKLRTQAENLRTRLEELQRDLPGLVSNREWLSKIDEFDRAAVAFSDTFILRRLGAYRTAKRFYKETLQGKNLPRSERVALLRSATNLMNDILTFDTDTEGKKDFGDEFKGFSTDFDAFSKAVDATETLYWLGQGKLCPADELPMISPEAFPYLISGDVNTVYFGFVLSDIRSVRIQSEKTEEEEALWAETAKEHLAFLNMTEATVEELEILAADCAAAADLNGRLNAPETWNELPSLRGLEASEIEDLLKGAIALNSLPAGEKIVAALGKDQATLEDLKDLTRREEELIQAVQELADAIGAPIPDDVWSIAKNYAVYARAAETPTDLFERGKLARSEAKLEKIELKDFIDWFKSSTDSRPKHGAHELVEAYIAKAMADAAIAGYRHKFESYAGEDLDQIRASIAKWDLKLIELSRNVVHSTLIDAARPLPGNSVGRESSYTEMALIRHEISKQKQKRRVGVRELTRRAGRTLLELKPCWMMSPLAVAQYLHDGLEFDLLIIDEASQMTPENAIGALKRVKQAAIVGDTKQLPPTTFFSHVLENEDIDEDLRVDSESVLDLANSAFSSIRQLRWHYRSRHSSLIKFSNHWMYKDALSIFPGANEEDPKMGVFLVPVKGSYKDSKNVEEAKEVVVAVGNHMRNDPDLSLGVCTMNSEQMDLILQEFEREREKDSAVRSYMNRWEKERGGLEDFFIKNLETIQGDERDVMFISTVYGPEDDRVMQRFGPINLAHGDRRLNVLFSRAKERVVTFSSLQSSDILADDSKNKGVRMFRAWLEYSATGDMPENSLVGGSTESPFEDHVIRELERLGYEAVPQVGAGRFRIDIGVRHPEWPDGYVLGVECDGASYHSSRSARDRDRLREEILLGRGWRLHRIWSTDWFRNAKSEIKVLHDAVEEALNFKRADRILKKKGDAVP